MMRVYTIATLLVVASAVGADDWPQFLGPRRDGVSQETGVKAWGADGPPVLWSRELGSGYAGPVIAGDRMIVFHRVSDQEIVECLGAADGKPRWRFAYPTTFVDDFGKGDGPRATPAISGNSVVTYGADGWLHALDLATGKKRWGKSVVKDYAVPPSYFGVGSSPLVLEDRVLVNVGGKQAGIVAFALDTGKELWKATGDGASYASPTLAKEGEVTHAIFFTRNGPVILDPATGKVRFSMRWRARIDASVNAATPLVIGEQAFFSTSYDTGALLLKLTENGAKELWDTDELMTNHYNTSIYHDGHLYGFHGRQEAGPSFRCVELKTQRVKWEKTRFGCGSMILADGKLIVLMENGELLLVEATPAAYRELARTSVFDAGPCRAQIALANGRLYGRDQKQLKCFAVK